MMILKVETVQRLPALCEIEDVQQAIVREIHWLTG